MSNLFWSDLFDLLLNPLLWVIVLFIVAVFTKKPRRRMIEIWVGIVSLVVFSNAFIVDEALRNWEDPPVQLSRAYNVGIVLGGGMAGFDGNHDQMYLNSGSSRFIEAMELVKEGQLGRFIISGGPADRLYPDVKEAKLLSDFARLFLDSGSVFIEDSSKTTYQNALFTARLLKREKMGGDLLLITSALHMPRAKACFMKQGMDFHIYPVGRLSGERRWSLLLRFEPQSLVRWQALLHEIVGMAYYKITGKA